MTPSSRSRNTLILIVGCLVSAVALWFALHNIEWKDFFAAMRAFKLVWLIPAFAAFYFSMYLRAVRWGLLFRPHRDIKGHEAFGPIMIGFGFNSILPARVGEVIRCVAINRKLQTGFGKALATVVAERILDALALLGSLVFALKLRPINENIAVPEIYGYQLEASMISNAMNKLVIFCVVLIVAVIMLLIPAVQRLVLAVIARLAFLPRGIRDKFDKLFRDFAIGFDALKQPWPLAQIVFHTLAIWALVGVSNITVAYGFEIQMDFWQSMAIVGMISFAIMIPAAPGFWGLYEAGAVFSMLVLGLVPDTTRALAFGLTTHMLQWAPVVVTGLYFAARDRIKPADAKPLEAT